VTTLSSLSSHKRAYLATLKQYAVGALAAPAKISEHVYWLPPGPPDRPSLCAVVGERGTIWLDAGASPAHAGEFLAFLAGQGIAKPSHVILSHSHWDHVFGAAELGAYVVAHELTAGYLEELADTDWSDEALERRVASGEASSQHAENVKAELPSPRRVEIAHAAIVFREGVRFDLGGVRVEARHIGGDHADDSTVSFVEPDGVLFLGDCLYEAPSGGYTVSRAQPLSDAIRSFGAKLHVEGHNESVLSQAELDEVIAEAIATVGPMKQT
jgi:glyoxylase-like metal-dependent hydrolase (beta-lactamase superfamily II)